MKVMRYTPESPSHVDILQVQVVQPLLLLFVYLFLQLVGLVL